MAENQVQSLPSGPGKAFLIVTREQLGELLGLPEGHQVVGIEYMSSNDAYALGIIGPDLPVPQLPGTGLAALELEYEIVEEAPEYRERRIRTRGYTTRPGGTQ